MPTVSDYPNGIFATPNIGAGTLADMWNSGQVYFIDGDNGDSGQTGLGPANSVAKPSTAIAMANSVAARGSTFYVRPRTTSNSAQIYYADNISIPLSLPGISIIGAGANPMRPYMGVDIKASNTADPVVNVKAEGVLLQGLRLAGTGQDASATSYIVKAVADSANGLYCSGLTIRGVQFGNARQGGAVYLNSPASVQIEGCLFHECLTGISTSQSYASYADWGLHVKDCTFGGRSTVRAVDILMSQGGLGNSTVGSTHNIILRCLFTDDVPSNSAGSNQRYIKIINADMGMIKDCGFGTQLNSGVADAFGAAGNRCIVPTTWVMLNCWTGANGTTPINKLA